MYQLWDIKRTDKEQFSFKVLQKEDSFKILIEEFHSLCCLIILGRENRELWIIEEDNDGVFRTKYKFKWEKL